MNPIDQLYSPVSFDPLLDCLLIVAKKNKQQLSPQTLTAGLALNEGKLTMESFLEAAKRAKLKGQFKKKKLSNLSPSLFPCLLILNNNNCCIVEKSQASEYVLRLSNNDLITVDKVEFETHYAGFCIYLGQQDDDLAGDKQRNISASRWFWRILWESKANYRHIAACAVLINLFALGMPLFIMNVYDRVIPNEAYETLWVLATGLLIIFTFDFFLKMLRSYLIELSGKQADLALSDRIFQKILHLPLQNIPSNRSELQTHLENFKAVRAFFSAATISVLSDIPFVLLFISVMAVISSQIVILPLIAIPLILISSFFLELPLRQVIRQQHFYALQHQQIVSQSINGLNSIKTLQYEGQTMEQWRTINRKQADTSMVAKKLASNSLNTSMFIQQTTAVLLVCYGAYLIASGDLSVGGLIACVAISARAIAPFTQLSSLVSRYQQAKLGLESLNQIISLPSEIKPVDDCLNHSQLNGDIAFSNVCLDYPGQKQSALFQINLSIKPQEKIAILGPVGSGKSSLLRLIIGLYQSSQGLITLDGLDINQLQMADLRSQISFLSGDESLFAGTLRENIMLANPGASDDLLQQAIKVCGLSSLISQHEQGLSLPIGEQGEGLSNGQRQAVFLARTIIKNSPILLLDEPTSMLDSNSENEFIRQMKHYTQPRTLILTTHKTNLLELVDRIIILDKGKVIADGPKATVLTMLT